MNKTPNINNARQDCLRGVLCISELLKIKKTDKSGLLNFTSVKALRRFEKILFELVV